MHAAWCKLHACKCGKASLCACCYAVSNHLADLVKLQKLVTQQSQRDYKMDTYVVVIDELRVVNSSARHKQLRELFQLTTVCRAVLALMHSLFVLVCCFSLLNNAAYAYVDAQSCLRGTSTLYFDGRHPF